METETSQRHFVFNWQLLASIEKTLTNHSYRYLYVTDRNMHVLDQTWAKFKRRPETRLLIQPHPQSLFTGDTLDGWISTRNLKPQAEMSDK